MKTIIHEIGVIDKQGTKHPVKFVEGLNVVTGKSSTGKSALIEIFDYCFGSSEYTVPKGVITDCAEIYYVIITVKENVIVIARAPELPNKAFLRDNVIFEKSNEITQSFFNKSYFIPLDSFKKQLRNYFLDIDDVDESLVAKELRNKKAVTPSIRSFTTFMLQHQNLIANKHALFYRFDEKEKREQVIDHTKIFLGLVDQNYFLLSQNQERCINELRQLQKNIESKKKIAKTYENEISPLFNELCALMGIEDIPVKISEILQTPQLAKDRLDQLIIPEKIDYTSNKLVERYEQLKEEREKRSQELKKLQRKASSIKKYISEEKKFSQTVNTIISPNKVNIANTLCPFCHSKITDLNDSTKSLKNAIDQISNNLGNINSSKAMFETSLNELNHNIESMSLEISVLSQQIDGIKKMDEEVEKRKSLYERILMKKAQLFVFIDTINASNDSELERQINELTNKLKDIQRQLDKYQVEKMMAEASSKINEYMKEIGSNFDFEYKPINLKFSFETFDLYQEMSDGSKVYLRSMGSGANWLYSHITLFLALHKFFVKLGDKCAIPSILFLDQPTQVYFPNFNRDISESFKKQSEEEQKQRQQSNIIESVDEDIKAVEELFSQLSIYCNDLKEKFGYSPQIIVTDHADGLNLSNGVDFETIVNGNRWRDHGFINPIPSSI